jgi:hypothetical protein
VDLHAVKVDQLWRSSLFFLFSFKKSVLRGISIFPCPFRYLFDRNVDGGLGCDLKLRS